MDTLDKELEEIFSSPLDVAARDLKEAISKAKEEKWNLVEENDLLKKEIKELNFAITLLKGYIVNNGLKPFWETQILDPKKLTPAEIIERNRQTKVNLASSEDAVDQPSFEEQEESLKKDVEETPRLKKLVDEILDAADKNRAK